MYKLTGTLKVINETVQVTEKFSKREFVVSDSSSMYPQEISFQAAQDKCAVLDAFNVGEQIEVSFNIRGREWVSPQGEVKYFNTLDAWRVEKVQLSSDNSNDVINHQSVTPSEEDNNLPF